MKKFLILLCLFCCVAYAAPSFIDKANLDTATDNALTNNIRVIQYKFNADTANTYALCPAVYGSLYKIVVTPKPTDPIEDSATVYVFDAFEKSSNTTQIETDIALETISFSDSGYVEFEIFDPSYPVTNPVAINVDSNTGQCTVKLYYTTNGNYGPSVQTIGQPVTVTLGGQQ